MTSFCDAIFSTQLFCFFQSLINQNTGKHEVTDDNELILKAQSGDEASFDQIVNRYERRVLSTALKFVKNRDDAKDVFQEVFLRIYRNMSKFRFQSELSTWIYRITVNVCLTYNEKNKKRNLVSINGDEEYEEQWRGSLVSTEYSPDETTSSSEIKEMIYKVLVTLPERQKMSFILKHFEGYKIREISVMLDCKEGTIKKYLFEATHTLQKRLRHYYERN